MTKSTKRFLAGAAVVLLGALGLGGCYPGSGGDGCPTSVYDQCGNWDNGMF